MAGITLTTAQTRLDDYLAAEKAVLDGQAYQIGNRSFRRADLSEIREGIKFWNGQVETLSAGGGRRGIRIRGATPI